MKSYVLKSKPYDNIWDGYYTGNTYRFQGERYAVCDTDIKEAKRYTSRKRAENASYSVASNYDFEVMEIDE